MSHPRPTTRQQDTYKARINNETNDSTKFYDVSEGTGTLKKSLFAPVLPQLIENSPKKLLSALHQQMFQFAQPRRIGETQLDSILCDFKNGALFFIGHAGSGKTTLLKHIAQLVLEDELLSLTGIELVLYIKCQELCLNTEIYEEELFFGGIFGSEAREVIQFVNLHQSQCLFLLDSVETCLNPEVMMPNISSIDSEKKRKPGEILANLISGRRFPNARIIATSRYPLDVPEARFVYLNGLSRLSVLNIMKIYLGNKKGTEEFENLSLRYPHLASLCSTPVFLIYVLMAQMSEGKTFSLSTISQVMIRLLDNFLRSKHLQQDEGIDRLLSALKSVSYEGLEKAKIIFSRQDFKQQNLTSQEAGDFTTQHWLLRKLLRGGQFVHFNHVSLQEAFAAIYVAEMEHKKFRDHAERRLLPSPQIRQKSLARSLVFGILLDPDIEKDARPLLSNHQNLKRNRAILLELLQKFFTTNQDLNDMELICALHEANGGATDAIGSIVRTIKIDPPILFPHDFFAIGSVTSRCKHLSELALNRANMSSEHLELLHCAMVSTVQVDTLSLSDNPNLAHGGLNTAGRIVSSCKTKKVKLDGSIVFPEDIASFSQGVVNHKMDKLDLSWNTKMENVLDMTPEKEDLDLVYHFKADMNSVQNLNVPEVHRRNILENLHRQEFEQPWKIAGEWRMAPPGLFKQVIKILPKVTEKLYLHGWKFSNEEISLIDKSLRELKRKDLKVSLGKDMILPDTNRNLFASKESKVAVRCVLQNDAIIVSWDRMIHAKFYIIQIFRGGEKTCERRVVDLSYTERSINPSTSYEFVVTPQYKDGVRGSESRSKVVITDPKPPVWVEAKETDDGIYVSWKPAENDKVEKYAVKATRLEHVTIRTELFEKTDYLFENLIPGCKYRFEIEPYNSYGRRGRAATSSVVKFTGRRKESISNAHSEFSKRQKISGSKLTMRDIPCERFNGIQTEKELQRWCDQRCKSEQIVSFQEIQIAHEPLDDSKIQFLSNILRLSSTVGELELRDCGLNEKYLTRLGDDVSNLNCKFEQVTVGAEKNFDGLMVALCTSVCAFEARILNLADNDIRSSAVRSLLEILSKIQDKSLQGVDFSFNKNIEDWEDVGKMLQEKSLTILKAMGCDLTPQDFKRLQRGIAGWKIKHLDLSYNSDLAADCFEIIPSLLSEDSKLLVLSECGLTKYEIDTFDHCSSSQLTVETIDVSYNDDLGVEGISAVGSLVVHRKARNLNLAGCNLDGELLGSLSVSLGTHSLVDVDMSDNPAIGDEIERVAEFTRKQKIRNLNVSECGLSTGQIKSFQEGLGGTQISILNVSDSTRKADIPFITSICLLIPFVKTELVAIFPKTDQGCLDIIQKALNDLRENGPLVTYATAAESTSLSNGFKFTIGTEKKTLRKKNLI